MKILFHKEASELNHLVSWEKLEKENKERLTRKPSKAD